MLADDDDGIRQVLKTALTKQGYTVLDAADGAAALRLSRSTKKHIDLLVTDVLMPEMTGPALAEAIAAERPGCRVLFMSGYNEEGAIARLIEERPDCFVQKPFAANALLARVRALLDRPDTERG